MTVRLEELWCEAEGARLFARQTGTGPVLVMLHGAMADHRAAWPLIASLAERYRLVLPDVRGSGRSRYSGPLDFDQLADDLEAWRTQLGVEHFTIGGVSSGSGIALSYALRYPRRVKRLVLVRPVYAGSERGYTDAQQSTFTMMNSLAVLAKDQGLHVMRPLYANLPAAMREKALEMLSEFDAASVAATCHFMASGDQPFTSAADLERVSMPVLLVRGDDPLHPAHVSDCYATRIPACTAVEAGADVADAIAAHGQ